MSSQVVQFQVIPSPGILASACLGISPRPPEANSTTVHGKGNQDRLLRCWATVTQSAWGTKPYTAFLVRCGWLTRSWWSSRSPGSNRWMGLDSHPTRCREQVGRPAAYCGGMGEIVVVYELDNPMAKRSSLGIAAGEQRSVRKLHAAPSAPGEPSATGPRTLCGKDTFAMQTACWKPSEHPGAPWYPVQYASVVCSDCDAVIET